MFLKFCSSKIVNWPFTGKSEACRISNFLTNDYAKDGQCTIKMFLGGRGGDTFKPPPLMNNFCLYPPPVLKCFWKDRSITPTSHHPSFKHLSLLPPTHPTPLPPNTPAPQHPCPPPQHPCPPNTAAPPPQ